MDNKVYIVACTEYAEIEAKLSNLMDLMGGMQQFAQRGENIVLKVNLLREARPDEAVTTHPSLVAAVARMAKENGAKPIIADSPGGGYRYNAKTLDKIYRTCGMHQAARQADIEVNWDTSSRPVSYAEGRLTKHFDIITPVYEAQAVFNLCKMKTHVFTGMTGAVKNIFGVIPGLTKPGYHAKLSDVQRFAGMLLDLAGYISPRLTIMDAVVAMEGDGPGAGDPRPVGLLLGSENPLALDVVAGEIMNLDPTRNPIIVEAEERALNPTRIEDIDIIVSTSIDESFSHPVAEGMAAGVFPIVFAWEEAREIFPSDHIFTTPREFVSLVRNWMTSDKKLQSELARRFIEDNYSLDRQLAEIDTLLFP